MPTTVNHEVINTHRINTLRNKVTECAIDRGEGIGILFSFCFSPVSLFISLVDQTLSLCHLTESLDTLDRHLFTLCWMDSLFEL